MQMMLKTLGGMQIIENVMDYFFIQLILYNGRKLIKKIPEFGKESRNLRLGLATDETNPFGNLSSNHSS